MQKLFVPFLCDDSSLLKQPGSPNMSLFVEDGLIGYVSMDAAVEAAKLLSLKNPKGKVVILASARVVEPRRIDFVEKVFTDSGELHAT